MNLRRDSCRWPIWRPAMTLISSWSTFLGGRNLCDLVPNEGTDGVHVQKRISGLACDPVDQRN